MSTPKLVRVQEKGQVTLPTAIRRKLGLRKGDLVAVVETDGGVLITPQRLVAAADLERIGEALRGGLTLDEVLAVGRELQDAAWDRVHQVQDRTAAVDPDQGLADVTAEVQAYRRERNEERSGRTKRRR